MQDFPDDTRISTFEDLDPEPEEKARRWRGLEIVLGVVLLAVVAGWAGSQWLDQQQRAAQYNSAHEAAARHDWDAARRDYLALGNFRDAPARAAEADRTITERNQKYAVALLSASFGRWAETLQAARAVQQIQPNFRTTTDLESAAEKQVYRQAVSGTLALRTRVEQPGIYYRNGDAWQWLQGSDRYSEVLGIGTPDHTVFDAPGPGWAEPSTPELQLGQARLFGRNLMEASLSGDKVTTRQLLFDPAVYGIYFWGEKGVWGVRYSNRAPRDTQDYGRIDSAYASAVMEYQAWDDTQLRTVDLPGLNWFVMDLGRDGNHILLAEMAGQKGQESHLYIAGPDGSNRQLIYSYTGTLESARFSPDRRFVLLVANGQRLFSTGYGPMRDIVLLDLSGKQIAYTLSEQSGPDPCPDVVCERSSAVFLNQGALSGKILLAEWGPEDMDGRNLLSLIDPEYIVKPISQIVVESVPPTWTLPARVSQSPDGRTVTVTWWPPSQQNPAVARLGLDGQPGTAWVNWRQLRSVTWIVMRDDNLIASRSTLTNGPTSEENGLSISSLALHDLSDKSTSRDVLTDLTDVSDGNRLIASSWFPGPDLFAYIKNDVLHARTYNGNTDVTLESGVTRFFYIPYTEVAYLH